MPKKNDQRPFAVRPKRGERQARKHGRIQFVPTDNQRAAVKMMTGYGIPQDRMRLAIINPDTGRPITKETLAVVFEKELEVGSIETDMIAMTSLVKNMNSGNQLAVQWYMKNRMGWKDQAAHELTGPDGQPLPAGGGSAAPPPLVFMFVDDGEDEEKP